MFFFSYFYDLKIEKKPRRICVHLSIFKQTYFYVIAIGVFVCLPTSNITFDAGAVDILWVLCCLVITK